MEEPSLRQTVGERLQHVQLIRNKLKESGVIGDIVNDFVPHMQLYVIFGNKRISLGEHLSAVDVTKSNTKTLSY